MAPSVQPFSLTLFEVTACQVIDDMDSDCLLREYALGVRPTSRLNSSMNRFAPYPVSPCTSAMRLICGRAVNRRTAWATAGCSSRDPRSRDRRTSSSTLNNSTGDETPDSLSRASLAKDPQRSPRAIRQSLSSSAGTPRKGVLGEQPMRLFADDDDRAGRFTTSSIVPVGKARSRWCFTG